MEPPGPPGSAPGGSQGDFPTASERKKTIWKFLRHISLHFGGPFGSVSGHNGLKKASPKRKPGFCVNRAPVYTGARFLRSRGLQHEVKMRPKRSPNVKKGAAIKDNINKMRFPTLPGPEKKGTRNLGDRWQPPGGPDGRTQVIKNRTKCAQRARSPKM